VFLQGWVLRWDLIILKATKTMVETVNRLVVLVLFSLRAHRNNYRI
jgi:hypothetical protein